MELLSIGNKFVGMERMEEILRQKVEHLRDMPSIVARWTMLPVDTTFGLPAFVLISMNILFGWSSIIDLPLAQLV